MKNKTKNKLARNTVRVRKKQRAQEGEKTKKKPNKRLLVRVGSIVACMLLVGALTVPCFADTDAFDIPSPVIEDCYAVYQRSGIPSSMKNGASTKILTKYTATIDNMRDFLNSSYFMSGTIQKYGGRPLANLTPYNDASAEFFGYDSVDAVIYCERVGGGFFAYEYYDVQVTYVGAVADGVFEYLSVNAGYEDDSFGLTYYPGIDDSSIMELDKIRLAGVIHSADDFVNIDIALLFNREPDMRTVGVLTALFFGDDDVNNHLSSPNVFLDGYVNSIPIFEQTPPTDELDIKNAFIESYGLSVDSPLRRLLNSSNFESISDPYCFQFMPPVQTAVMPYPELLTYDENNTNQLSYAVVYNRIDSSFVETGVGYWSTNYTTSGSNRILFLKFHEYLDGSTRIAFQVRVSFDSSTYVVNSSTVSSNFYPIDGYFDHLVIGTITNKYGSAPLYYYSQCGYSDFSVAVDYRSFANSYSRGYMAAGDIAFDAGYELGKEHGIEEGYDYGYNRGETDGFAAGQKVGYEAGLKAENNEAFQNGYNKAVSEIDSGEFGRNFLANVFNAPMHAMNEFVIASWQTPGGDTMHITLGLVLGSVIGLMIFVWFLKMFAGG